MTEVLSNTQKEELLFRAFDEMCDGLLLSPEHLMKWIRISPTVWTGWFLNQRIPIAREPEMAALMTIYHDLCQIFHLPSNRKNWLQQENEFLRGKPIELMQTADGMEKVKSFLYTSAVRG